MKVLLQFYHVIPCVTFKLKLSMGGHFFFFFLSSILGFVLGYNYNCKGQG